MWIRSWPKWFHDGTGIPEHLRNRPFVVDHDLPRYDMSNFDYNTLEWPDADVCMLEWDIALDRQGREEFQRRALQIPDRVSTAGYHLSDGRWLTKGFGCIYLPRWTVKAFLGTKPELFSDATFFRWYDMEPLHIHTVHPQHLNS